MSDENVEEHALMSDVGMKSRLDDLGCKEWRSFKTSAGVTGETVEKSSPEWIGSGSGSCKRSVSFLDFMAILRLLILEMKKFKNVVEFIVIASWVIVEGVRMEEIVNSFPTLFSSRARVYWLCQMFLSGVVDEKVRIIIVIVFSSQNLVSVPLNVFTSASPMFKII